MPFMYDNIASAYLDSLQNKKPESESETVVKTILSLIENRFLDFDHETSKILDFGVCNGEVGELFA